MKQLWRGSLRVGFHLLYHQMAFTYNTVANVVSMGQWWDWQRCALDYLPADGMLLELAHGTGRLHYELIERGWDVVGFDLSPQMGHIANRYLRRKGYAPRLIRGRAQTLPFGDNQFAAIVSTFPTPFIIEPETLAEVRRVLIPNGRLVFVPNAVLTRGGVAKQALESAYRVTGQRESWSYNFPNFVVEQHFVELRRSTVQVVVATPQQEKFR